MQQKTDSFPKISAPAMRALEAAGYTHAMQLTADLSQLHGMGPKPLDILREMLKKKTVV